MCCGQPTKPSTTDLDNASTPNSTNQTSFLPDDCSTPNPFTLSKKRKTSSINSKQISDKDRQSLKDLQVLLFSTLNIPFVLADKQLFWAWLSLLFSTMQKMEGVLVENMILGSTALQTNGVKLHAKFKSRINLLLSGNIFGMKAAFALSTDGWTSCDGKSFLDLTMRIMITFSTGVSKIYNITVDMLVSEIKENLIQYNKTTASMLATITRSLEQFGLKVPLRQACSCDNTSAAKNLANAVSSSS